VSVVSAVLMRVLIALYSALARNLQQRLQLRRRIPAPSIPSHQPLRAVPVLGKQVVAPGG
jgi:hypothetical protein